MPLRSTLSPLPHAASHVDGSDDIQDATAAQKGVMTAAYATRLDDLESTDNADFGGLTIDTDVLYVDPANDYIGMGTTATNTDNQVHVVMTASKDILVDGTTNPRSIDTGVIRFEQTPSIPNTRCIHCNVYANSHENTHAIAINMVAQAIAAGEVISGVDVALDRSTSTGGHLHAFEVSTAGAGSAEVYAMHAGAGVKVLHQEVGTFGNIEQAFSYDGGYTDTTAAFNATGTDVTLFAGDDDYVYIGMAATFNQISVQLDTAASNPGIKPVFEYSDGAAGWVTFTPSDETLGFRQTGVIVWTTTDLATWAQDTVNAVGSKYWVRIQRTQNNLTTDPIEDLIQVSTDTEFEWDENADVSMNQLTVTDPDIVGQAMQFGITIDGDGSVPSTGVKGYIPMPRAGTLTQATMLGSPSGSAVIDVWYEDDNTLPVVADTITAAAKPTLTTAVRSVDSTLTGWTTAFTAGGIYGFNLDSVTTCTWVQLTLEYTVA